MPQTGQVRIGIRAVAGILTAVLAAPCVPARHVQAQTLPATRPTSLPPGNAVPVPTAAQPLAGEPSKPRHAQVTYVEGQLDIRADDSSLNQILRSISRRTGLKITGGVADQRVFGEYGPGPTSSVLATLLDGTDTNILLLDGDATSPPELVLTPRKGGPSPPGPDSPIYAAYDDSSDGVSPAQPAPRNAAPMPRPPAPGSTTGSAPNGTQQQPGQSPR